MSERFILKSYVADAVFADCYRSAAAFLQLLLPPPVRLLLLLLFLLLVAAAPVFAVVAAAVGVPRINGFLKSWAAWGIGAGGEYE